MDESYIYAECELTNSVFFSSCNFVSNEIKVTVK